MPVVVNAMEGRSGKAPELLNCEGAEIKIFNRLLKSTFMQQFGFCSIFLLPFSVPVSQKSFFLQASQIVWL